MSFGSGVVDCHATRFLLFLFFRIVGGEIGRDAIPGLAVIAGAEEELRTDIDSAIASGAEMDGRVPIEAQFAFAIVLLRLNAACFQGAQI